MVCLWECIGGCVWVGVFQIINYNIMVYARLQLFTLEDPVYSAQLLCYLRGSLRLTYDDSRVYLAKGELRRSQGFDSLVYT